MMENFDWAGTACIYCSDALSLHSTTGVSPRGTRCLDTEPGFPEYARVRVYRETRPTEVMTERMWKGGCSACFITTQYWGFGATMGTMLEHIRRCDRFRYALSLVTPGQSPVSLRERISSSSGRQRDGDAASSRPPLAASPFTLPAGWKPKCTCEPRSHFCFQHGCMGFTRGPSCTHGR